MRTLEKNKQPLYTIIATGYEDVKDSDGNYTGEKIKTYSDINLIHLNIYPSNGQILLRLFGTDYNCDMVATSTDLVFAKGTMFFVTDPSNLSGDYEKHYDYILDRISHSLNVYAYGLKGR